MSIFARSPFIVEISETGQEGSKVELFLWNGTGAAPANPSYTLSKLIPATNNVNTYYNISPYIREFISFDTRFEIYNTYPAATNEQWCNVIYKRYKLDGGVYTSKHHFARHQKSKSCISKIPNNTDIPTDNHI